MSGKGALIESGRWHVSQTHACLYVATTPETALQEALAARRYDNLPDWKSLPRLLVGVKAKLHYLLDLTNGATRQRLRLSLATMLECDWRDDNRFERRESVTQAVGRACYDAGFEGLIVPSQADSPKGVNVVIFPEKLLQADSLRLETPIRW